VNFGLDSSGIRFIFGFGVSGAIKRWNKK